MDVVQGQLLFLRTPIILHFDQLAKWQMAQQFSLFHLPESQSTCFSSTHCN